MDTTTDYTPEQIATLQQRLDRQREYRKRYYETHKEQVKLYHKRHNQKIAAITRELKAQGLLQ